MTQERILVIGGCGFVGYHIVTALVGNEDYTIHVLSRNPTRNQVPGAHYHTGSIHSLEQLEAAFIAIRPSLIVHAASPVAAGGTGDDLEYQTTNVIGTRNLLEVAISSGYVKGFVYTSSAEVINATTHDSATEDAPIYTSTSRVDYYSKTKAIADQEVLDANNQKKLRTICLRIATVYGERDGQMIPNSLRVLREGRHRYQIGDNTSLFDFVSATNAAQSHVLAVQALLLDADPAKPKVDGEAFYITDGEPIPFWTFLRKIWSAAGVQAAPENAVVVPAWFILSLASVVEWIYWAFTFGSKKPRLFQRRNLSYSCTHKTYSIEKARHRLGYVPADNRDDEIRKGVAWQLQHEAGEAHGS